MHGSLLFLCENETGSTIYKAKLHNPISEIVKLSDDCEGDRISSIIKVDWCIATKDLRFLSILLIKLLIQSFLSVNLSVRKLS